MKLYGVTNGKVSNETIELRKRLTLPDIHVATLFAETLNEQASPHRDSFLCDGNLRTLALPSTIAQ